MSKEGTCVEDFPYGCNGCSSYKEKRVPITRPRLSIEPSGIPSEPDTEIGIYGVCEKYHKKERAK